MVMVDYLDSYLHRQEYQQNLYQHNKLLSKLEDKTILEHNIEQLKKIGFKKITLVIRNNSILKSITKTKIELIKGGKTRTLSVKNALLKSKIKAKSSSPIQSNPVNNDKTSIRLKSKRGRFKSLLLDANFEPAKNLSLEELTDETCKYMEGNPNEKDASFCGRKNVEKFSYCPLHLMIVFQPKGKKDDNIDKDEEMPKFIQKKIIQE